jgi:hypothetical protein
MINAWTVATTSEAPLVCDVARRRERIRRRTARSGRRSRYFLVLIMVLVDRRITDSGLVIRPVVPSATVL